jgi:ribonuclease P protein component
MAYPYRLYFKETALQEGKVLPVLFGVGVSKRYFKKAVDRNYIKRLTREAYRHRQEELKNVISAKGAGLDLFFIFTGKELPTLHQCEEALETGLQKLLRLLRPKS